MLLRFFSRAGLTLMIALSAASARAANFQISEKLALNESALEEVMSQSYGTSITSLQIGRQFVDYPALKGVRYLTATFNFAYRERVTCKLYVQVQPFDPIRVYACDSHNELLRDQYLPGQGVFIHSRTGAEVTGFASRTLIETLIEEEASQN
jgi:hypothetical protein